MQVEKIGNKYVVKLEFDQPDIDFLNYLRVIEITSKSKITDSQIEELVRDVKERAWVKMKENAKKVDN